MDRTRRIRRAGWLFLLAVCAATGCQTVRTPEEKIANSSIPTELKKVTMPDFHATLLHLLGFDHEQLTYRHAGRDYRLTDVHGHVVQEIIT